MLMADWAGCDDLLGRAYVIRALVPLEGGPSPEMVRLKTNISRPEPASGVVHKLTHLQNCKRRVQFA